LSFSTPFQTLLQPHLGCGELASLERTSKKCSSAVSDGGYWAASLATYLRKNSSARALAELRYAYSASNPSSDHNPKDVYESVKRDLQNVDWKICHSEFVSRTTDGFEDLMDVNFHEDGFHAFVLYSTCSYVHILHDSHLYVKGEFHDQSDIVRK
jgi:hypothetical protein